MTDIQGRVILVGGEVVCLLLIAKLEESHPSIQSRLNIPRMGVFFLQWSGWPSLCQEGGGGFGRKGLILSWCVLWLSWRCSWSSAGPGVLELLPEPGVCLSALILLVLDPRCWSRKLVAGKPLSPL